MNPSNRSFFISILRFPSKNLFLGLHKSIHPIIDQLFKKFIPLARKCRRWGKNGPSEICPVAASRNNIVTTRDSTHSRRRIAVSMHCYGERIVTSMFLRIYTSLASIVTLQPRWICRSVAFSFFFFFFFKLISFKIGRALFRVPCFRDNSKFRKIFLLLKIFPSSSI